MRRQVICDTAGHSECKPDCLHGKLHESVGYDEVYEQRLFTCVSQSYVCVWTDQSVRCVDPGKLER